MSRRGFTLIELLVVISIIGLLSSIVLAAIGESREKARIARAASDLKQIDIALELFLLSNGRYPCLDGDWDDNSESSKLATYIQWPKTPWGDNYNFDGGMLESINLVYSISIQNIYSDRAQRLDEYMDDGILTDGKLLQIENGRIEYIGNIVQDIPICY